MSISTDRSPTDTGSARARSRWRRDRFALAAGRPRRRSGVALWLAVLWLLAIVLAAVLAGILPIKGYGEADFNHIRQGPGLRWPEPLGTDALGRSELSRVIYGARVSLAVGFLSVAIGFVVGTSLGIIAGYFRGKVEAVINIVTDTLLAIPPLVLLLGITVVLTPSLRNLVVGLAVLGTPTFTRLARASTLTVSRREFVAAAQILGAPRWRVVLREITPNVLLPVGSFCAEIIGVFIVAESSLSFLNLGVPPPQPTWGGMIAEGYPDLSTAPALTFVPTVALFLTVFSFKIVGDRLRSRLDLREGLL